MNFTELSLIAAHTDDLPVTQGGHLTREGVSLPCQITLVHVVQQDESNRVRHGDQSGVVARGRQPISDQLQEPVVIRKDDVFLGTVVPEERRAPEACSLGDVVDGRLLVSALVEERECGGAQSNPCRWLAHERSSFPVPLRKRHSPHRDGTEYCTSGTKCWTVGRGR
jgi:hypothetical protein